MRSPVLAGAVCAALLLPAAPARAGYSNYQDVIVGERAAGMGGAFTALADDASAAYYNPAGLATVGSQNLSLSANVFDFKWQRQRGYFHGKDLRASSVSFFPSDWYTVIHTTRATYAIAVIVPENLTATASDAYHDPDGELMLDSSQSVQTYLIGPAFGTALSPRLQVGAAAYLLYGRYNSNFHGKIIDPATSQVADELFQEYKGYKVGFMGMAGLKYRLCDRLRLGWVLRSGAQPRHTEDQLNVEYTRTGGAINRSGTELKKQGYYSRIPWSTTVGLAWLPNSAWTWAADLSLYAAARTNAQGTSYENKTTWNLNLGAEYAANPSMPVRFGLFTNNSAAPSPSAVPVSQPADVDQYGVTASVGYIKGTVSTAFGLKLAGGWGQSQSIEGNVIDVMTQEASLFLGGTFRF
ncbi:MAG: hypothetical protein PHU21_13355 [Elusimicrobia bacterium]|nr:hypothetical protein [Elusimicrobiota bacterium]